MDRLSQMTVSEICQWLSEQGISSSVVENFRENEVDGDALVTLVGATPGPDCLKELITKIGARMKVFKLIKSFCDNEHELEKQDSSDTSQHVKGNKDVISRSSTGSRKVEQKQDVCDGGSGISKELFGTLESSPSCSGSSTSSPSFSGIKRKRSPKLAKSRLPKPFPIPTFRRSTEENLKKQILTLSDRKYMVQTLGTLMMTYVSKPSTSDCLEVSRTLHKKFKFLEADGSSENSWKWFLYNRTQNVNRPSESDQEPAKKTPKVEDKNKHYYPIVPDSADDETSNQRNKELLMAELKKPRPCHQTVKALMTRTFTMRREAILTSQFSTIDSVLEEYPMLKRSSYARLEFELIVQRAELKEQFDEEMILWAKAVVLYCKRSCAKSTAIKSLTGETDVDSNCDDHFLMKALRCLALLLTTDKLKKTEGDIPYLIKFVPDGTPLSEAPDPNNTQPHIIAITHDDYNQYFIAVEKGMYMESTDIATAVFLLLGTHYVFNLSYHAKVFEVMRFVQEKVGGIPSERKTKHTKSAVASSHLCGIVAVYEQRKNENHHADIETADTDIETADTDNAADSD